MESLFSELPLTLFTTLAPLGAGAFAALAIAFRVAEFSDEELARIDKMTLVPLGVVLVAFLCATAHLANPLHAPFAILGLGASPLTNEVAVGVVFFLAAIVYVALALAGKLARGARMAFTTVLSLLAVAFAVFMGLAYMIPTIPSWNLIVSPVAMVGYLLSGGAALGVVVLGAAHALNVDRMQALRMPLSVMALAGAVLAIVGLGVQLGIAGGLSNPLVQGASLVSAALPYAVGGLACVALGAVVAPFVALRKAGMGAAVAACSLSLVGIFAARVAFYAVQLSVGFTL